MRMKLGSRLVYDLAEPTPMIAILNVHSSRVSELEYPDHLKTDPPVPVDAYRDGFGNWCSRMVAPSGRFVLGTETVIRESGQPDPYAPEAREYAVEELPSEALEFLLGSRYCETDRLSDIAWQLFEHVPPGWARVQAICDYVNEHIIFGYEHARATRTAAEGWEEKKGVCRDFAHLAVTFCRCMNVPTRYCTGYISDIGFPTDATMDFAAWMEVFLGGRWWTFDPRNNQRRIGRVLIARGRDAADVPLTLTFGDNSLREMEVFTHPIPD